jgi:hypothetical protein
MTQVQHTCNCSAALDPDTNVFSKQYECEDIWKDAFLFDAVGAGLGRNEMYGIMLAVKKLGEDPKRAVSTVRFFGKFLGIHTDYYVFETTLQTPPEEEEKEPGKVHQCVLSIHANQAPNYVQTNEVNVIVQVQMRCQSSQRGLELMGTYILCVAILGEP